MYDYKPDNSLDTPERYRQLCGAADALTENESDAVANMANVAALIWEFVPGLNWAGFYRMGTNADGAEELVLGPFVGRPACIRIPIGVGVCGAAARGETQLVEDVHAFPGHIACDARSRSELVVPVILGNLLGGETVPHGTPLANGEYVDGQHALRVLANRCFGAVPIVGTSPPPPTAVCRPAH